MWAGTGGAGCIGPMRSIVRVVIGHLESLDSTIPLGAGVASIDWVCVAAAWKVVDAKLSAEDMSKPGVLDQAALCRSLVRGATTRPRTEA